MPRAQERRAGRSAPASNYSHEAVSVTSLGHHLPAVTQPASPRVKSQPRLDVTAPLTLPHQVPRESSCLSTSHSRCRSTVFQGLPTWPSSGCALRLLVHCEVQLCGSSFWQEISGPWGEKQQPLPSCPGTSFQMRCLKVCVLPGFAPC